MRTFLVPGQSLILQDGKANLGCKWITSSPCKRWARDIFLQSSTLSRRWAIWQHQACPRKQRGGRQTMSRWSLTQGPSSKFGHVLLLPTSQSLWENAASCRCSQVQQSTSTYSNLKHSNKGLQNGILISVRTKAILVWVSQLQQHQAQEKNCSIPNSY